MEMEHAGGLWPGVGMVAQRGGAPQGAGNWVGGGHDRNAWVGAEGGRRLPAIGVGCLSGD
jgi:hypothetical protein